eukprot:TRINITY_DN119811_c0_g1_i1.p1 TRINITY_DN119811_c0_g1~~TRINITY_DN119811_c0_g1_i1.p1  ORF type:complete len:340 (+),score=85.43 TRINITY_DN119811_c0_g1_i1:1-1020(+)
MAEGADVVGITVLHKLSSGWHVPMDLSLACGDSRMSNETRIRRIRQNVKEANFAKVVQRVRSLLKGDGKQIVADEWNEVGGALRFLVKQLDLIGFMPIGAQANYVRTFLRLPSEPDSSRWLEVAEHEMQLQALDLLLRLERIIAPKLGGAADFVYGELRRASSAGGKPSGSNASSAVSEGGKGGKGAKSGKNGKGSNTCDNVFDDSSQGKDGKEGKNGLFGKGNTDGKGGKDGKDGKDSKGKAGAVGKDGGGGKGGKKGKHGKGYDAEGKGYIDIKVSNDGHYDGKGGSTGKGGKGSNGGTGKGKGKGGKTGKDCDSSRSGKNGYSGKGGKGGYGGKKG